MGPKWSSFGVFGLEFEETIVISAISATEFVKMESVI